MATYIYGPYNYMGSHLYQFRSYLAYTTSSDDTTYTVNAYAGMQLGNNNGDVGENDIVTNLYLHSNYTATSNYRLSNADSAQRITTIPTKSYTWNKGHSAQSVTIYATISKSGYLAESKASLTISIPAKKSYTVTYDANGGTGAPSSQTKWHGENLTLRAGSPTRTGYDFLGWATSSTGSVAYQPGETYSSNASRTLYAKWQKKTYVISYNANGGTGAPSSDTKTYGVTLTLTTSTPTRSHYTFKGWATTSTGTVKYSPGGSYTANSAATLYAVWEQITYTVSYDKNTDDTVSNMPSSQTKYDGTDLTLSTKSPTRTGYNFIGWTYTSASTVIRYSPGDTFSEDRNRTLYAIWQLKTYIISYNSNGGTGSVNNQTKTYDIPISLYGDSIFTKPNCIIEKWNTQSNGEGTSYDPGYSYTGNAGLSLYAKWKTVYIPPLISNFNPIRVETSTSITEDDAGTYIRVSFGYAGGEKSGIPHIPSYKITIDSDEYTGTMSSTSGSFTSTYYGTNGYSPDTTHTVSVKLWDSEDETGNGTVKSLEISTAVYPIDIKNVPTRGLPEIYMGLMHKHVVGQPVTVPDLYIDGDLNINGQVNGDIDVNGDVQSSNGNLLNYAPQSVNFNKSTGATATLSVPSNSTGVIFCMAAHVNNGAIYLYNVSSSGAVTTKAVITGSNITISTSTNSITLTGASYVTRYMVITFYGNLPTVS